MLSGPEKQHEWLQQFIGEWTVESVCRVTPEEEPGIVPGTLNVRMIGDIWLLMDGGGVCPEMGPFHSMMTLGYDPQQECYVGSFVASMMTYLWQYRGNLNSSGTVLTMNTEGPKMDGEGMAKYQDRVEIISPNHWRLSSMIHVDGNWQEFMVANHHRKAK